MSAYLLHEQNQVTEAARSAAVAAEDYATAKTKELRRLEYLTPKDRELLMRHFDLIWNKFSPPDRAVDLGMVDA